MMKQYISRQDSNSLHYVKNNVNITFLFDLISARALLWPKPGVACDHKSLGLGDVCIYNSLAKITLGVFYHYEAMWQLLQHYTVSFLVGR